MYLFIQQFIYMIDIIKGLFINKRSYSIDSCKEVKVMDKTKLANDVCFLINFEIFIEYLGNCWSCCGL